MKKTILALIAFTFLAAQTQMASARDFRFNLSVPGVSVGVGGCDVRHSACYTPSCNYVYCQTPAPCAPACVSAPVCVQSAPAPVYAQVACVHPIPVVRIHMDGECYYGYYRPCEHRHW